MRCVGMLGPEAGHHLMMIADARSLAARWNARRQPPLDIEKLLNQAPTEGVRQYCGVHEENIASDTPYAQIAIEYEVEMLPLRYGELFVSRCVQVLGTEILPCLSFVTEHIVRDVATPLSTLGHSTSCLIFSLVACRRWLQRVPPSWMPMRSFWQIVLSSRSATLKRFDLRGTGVQVPSRGRCARLLRRRITAKVNRCQTGLTTSGRFADPFSLRAAGDLISGLMMDASPIRIRLTCTPITFWHTTGRSSLAASGSIV